MKTTEEKNTKLSLQYYEIHDESSNNILFIEAHTLEEAIEKSEHIDFSEYINCSSINYEGVTSPPYKNK